MYGGLYIRYDIAALVVQGLWQDLHGLLTVVLCIALLYTAKLGPGSELHCTVHW